LCSAAPVILIALSIRLAILRSYYLKYAPVKNSTITQTNNCNTQPQKGKMLLIDDFEIGNRLLLNSFVFGRNTKRDSLVEKAFELSERTLGPQIYTILILKIKT
jgi:hypothetical protein